MVRICKFSSTKFRKFYLADTKEQFLNNFYPTENPEEDNKVFNYWWLAHLVEVRLDAYLRTKNKRIWR